MARYHYYLVEGTYLVRWQWTEGHAEYVKPDGTWHDYPDHWDIATNGRYIGKDDELAMKKAKELFARLDAIGFKYR